MCAVNRKIFLNVVVGAMIAKTSRMVSFETRSKASRSFSHQSIVKCWIRSARGPIASVSVAATRSSSFDTLDDSKENVSYIFTLLSGSTASPRFEESRTRIIA